MKINKPLIVGMLFLSLRITNAAEFEGLGAAIAKALGTKKAQKRVVKVGKKNVTVFYSKGSNGKAKKLAVKQERVYDPNCTHTWIIGIDAKTQTVEKIRVVEMSCPHAFPCRKKSFLEQYIGKTPKDLKKLKKDATTIAKATGSSELTTDAVITSLKAATKLKGKL